MNIERAGFIYTELKQSPFPPLLPEFGSICVEALEEKISTTLQNFGYNFLPFLDKSFLSPVYHRPPAFTVKQWKWCHKIQVVQVPWASPRPCTERSSGSGSIVLRGGQKWLCCRRNHSAKLGFSFFTLDKLRNVIKLDLLHCSLTSGKLHLWFLVQWKGANYLFKCSFNVLQWHKAWAQPTACPNLPEVSPWPLALLSLFHFSSAPSLCPSKAPAVCRSCSWINPLCCLPQLALF